MITNKQLQALLSRAKSMSKTHRDTMWEALVFVRGTYERERAARDAVIERLTQANAELAAEVERLKAEAAVYISFEIDRFEHDEDGSRNDKRHYYARIRYQEMTGCDYEEE